MSRKGTCAAAGASSTACTDMSLLSGAEQQVTGLSCRGGGGSAEAVNRGHAGRQVGGSRVNIKPPRRGGLYKQVRVARSVGWREEGGHSGARRSGHRTRQVHTRTVPHLQGGFLPPLLSTARPRDKDPAWTIISLGQQRPRTPCSVQVQPARSASYTSAPPCARHPPG